MAAESSTGIPSGAVLLSAEVPDNLSTIRVTIRVPPSSDVVAVVA
jgi:hypothetical protein